MTHERTASSILLMSGMLLGSCASSDGEPDRRPAPVAQLAINELQPSNRDTITDEKGGAGDWIEILNVGDSAVDLLGFSLADSSGTTQVIAGPLIVAPGGLQLFWADDSPSQGPNHLGFKLSGKTGDQVTLEDASGRTVDAISFGPATGQDTFARFPDGTGAFAWCSAPTPGAANGAACPR